MHYYCPVVVVVVERVVAPPRRVERVAPAAHRRRVERWHSVVAMVHSRPEQHPAGRPPAHSRQEPSVPQPAPRRLGQQQRPPMASRLVPNYFRPRRRVQLLLLLYVQQEREWEWVVGPDRIVCVFVVVVVVVDP